MYHDYLILGVAGLVGLQVSTHNDEYATETNRGRFVI